MIITILREMNLHMKQLFTFLILHVISLVPFQFFFSECFLYCRGVSKFCTAILLLVNNRFHIKFISTVNNSSFIVSFIVSFCNFDICECYLKTKKIFSHFYLNISLTITYNIQKIFPVKSYNLFLDFFNTAFLYFN